MSKRWTIARALEVSEELGIAFFRSNAALWLAETELLPQPHAD